VPQSPALPSVDGPATHKDNRVVTTRIYARAKRVPARCARKGKGVSVSWKPARTAIRERIAANRRRYNEAPLRDEFEAQAIRALAAPSGPVLSKEHFRAVERDGVTRWVLLPEFVSVVRRQSARLGPSMYCRACGQDIPDGAPRTYFTFRWFDTDSKAQTGCVHHVECVRVTKI
jgi:hypothetical protein